MYFSSDLFTFPLVIYRSTYAWATIVTIVAALVSAISFAMELYERGMIDPEDMDLIHVIDEPENVVRAIFKHYETRGFEPSEAEREKQLYL